MANAYYNIMDKARVIMVSRELVRGHDINLWPTTPNSYVMECLEPPGMSDSGFQPADPSFKVLCHIKVSFIKRQLAMAL